MQLSKANVGLLQLAIDSGRFRTGDASLFAGGPDMGAILAAATDVAAAMAHLHSQVLPHSCPPVCACQKCLQRAISRHALRATSSCTLLDAACCSEPAGLCKEWRTMYLVHWRLVWTVMHSS